MKQEFYWQNVTKEKLLQNGFKYSRGFSCEESDAYIAYFPVYRYNFSILLDARIVAYLDGQVKIDIVDRCTKGIYATYYTYNVERAPIIAEIDKELTKIIKKLGVKQKNERKNKTFNRHG